MNINIENGMTEYRMKKNHLKTKLMRLRDNERMDVIRKEGGIEQVATDNPEK